MASGRRTRTQGRGRHRRPWSGIQTESGEGSSRIEEDASVDKKNDVTFGGLSMGDDCDGWRPDPTAFHAFERLRAEAKFGSSLASSNLRASRGPVAEHRSGGAFLEASPEFNEDACAFLSSSARRGDLPCSTPLPAFFTGGVEGGGPAESEFEALEPSRERHKLDHSWDLLRGGAGRGSRCEGLLSPPPLIAGGVKSASFSTKRSDFTQPLESQWSLNVAASTAQVLDVCELEKRLREEAKFAGLARGPPPNISASTPFRESSKSHKAEALFPPRGASHGFVSGADIGERDRTRSFAEETYDFDLNAEDSLFTQCAGGSIASAEESFLRLNALPHPPSNEARLDVLKLGRDSPSGLLNSEIQGPPPSELAPRATAPSLGRKNRASNCGEEDRSEKPSQGPRKGCALTRETKRAAVRNGGAGGRDWSRNAEASSSALSRGGASRGSGRKEQVSSRQSARGGGSTHGRRAEEGAANSGGSLSSSSGTASSLSSLVQPSLFPPPLFPVTAALKELVIQERAEDATRWFRPSKPSPSGNKDGGAEESLITSQDLDYILRLQLTQMAKRPEIQKYTGKWNFRFLNKTAQETPAVLYAAADLEDSLLSRVARQSVSSDGGPSTLGLTRSSLEGVLVANSAMHRLLFGSVSEEEADAWLRVGDRDRSAGASSGEALETLSELGATAESDGGEGGGGSSQSQPQQTVERKRFGRTGYSSIRHPRNMICIVKEATSPAEADPEDKAFDATLGSKPTAALITSQSQVKNAQLVRLIALGGPGISELRQRLFLLALIEDCKALLLDAVEIRRELEEATTGHVASRMRQEAQQQHLALEAAELLILRRFSRALPQQYSVLIDFQTPALASRPPCEFPLVLRQMDLLQQQTHLAEGAAGASSGGLEALPIDLKSLVEEGRHCTRAVLRCCVSRVKGLSLLLQMLPLLPDGPTACLIQGLLDGEVVLRLCREADAQLDATAPQKSSPRLLFSEVVDVLMGSVAAIPPRETLWGSLLCPAESLVSEVCEGRPGIKPEGQGTPPSTVSVAYDERLPQLSGALLALLLHSITKLCRTAGSLHAAVACAFAEHFSWGLSNELAMKILETRTGLCLVTVLTMFLPSSAVPTTAWQAEGARSFLGSITEALIGTTGALSKKQPSVEKEAKSSAEALAQMRPLLDALLEQARASPQCAAAVTTRATALLGETRARHFLEALVWACQVPL